MSDDSANTRVRMPVHHSDTECDGSALSVERSTCGRSGSGSSVGVRARRRHPNGHTGCTILYLFVFVLHQRFKRPRQAGATSQRKCERLLQVWPQGANMLPIMQLARCADPLVRARRWRGLQHALAATQSRPACCRWSPAAGGCDAGDRRALAARRSRGGACR